MYAYNHGVYVCRFLNNDCVSKEEALGKVIFYVTRERIYLAVMNNACDSMRILLKDPEIDYDKKNPINLRTPMHVALLHENLFAYRMLTAKQAEIETNTF